MKTLDQYLGRNLEPIQSPTSPRPPDTVELSEESDIFGNKLKDPPTRHKASAISPTASSMAQQKQVISKNLAGYHKYVVLPKH